VTLDRAAPPFRDRFAAASEAHRAGLLRLASHIVSPDDAEDIVQDALLKAWRRVAAAEFDPAAGHGDDEQNTRTYLYNAVRHRALDWREHCALLALVSLDWTEHEGLRRVPEAEHPEKAYLAAEAAREQRVRTAALLAALPARQARALLATSQDGATCATVAREWGTTRAAVKDTRYRAIEACRRAAALDGPGAAAVD
jgi:RNA polymerase sigma factor (sigma-70 family)